ncbi:MAG: kinase, partial [Xanthomonadaceae bacterium]|nr:kinase [Xanthomonadaceae bacterium]
MPPDSHPEFSSILARIALESVPKPSAHVPVLAITGPQGSGKSTLAAQIVRAADQHGLKAATLSTDDFYLTHADRRQLARTVHPLLATRGPPGTHDLPLALE